MKKIFLITALIISCKVDDTGYIEGNNLLIDPCTDGKEKKFDKYRLDGKFLTILYQESSALIIMQDSYQIETKTDAFYVQIMDFDEVKNKFEEAKKENTEYKFPLGGNLLRANLVPLRTCSDYRIPLMAKGTLVFKELGTKNGDNIIMNLNFDLIDGRSEDPPKILGKDFIGSLDFEVKDYPPYTPFANRE